MSFGINLLTFYTKYLPGDVFSNSMVIGLAALIFISAGPLASKLQSKQILAVGYLISSLGALSIIITISTCDGTTKGGLCDSISILVFITRCGLNLAFCFIFVIHTEIFPTFFLGTSYGLCNCFGRSTTLLAPLIAESANKMIPLVFLMISSVMGIIGSLFIRSLDEL